MNQCLRGRCLENWKKTHSLMPVFIQTSTVQTMPLTAGLPQRIPMIIFSMASKGKIISQLYLILIFLMR